MNGRSLMAAGPHRDTRAYGVLFDSPAAFQAGDIVDSEAPWTQMVDLQFI
jgi:hypothetical protein